MTIKPTVNINNRSTIDNSQIVVTKDFYSNPEYPRRETQIPNLIQLPNGLNPADIEGDGWTGYDDYEDIRAQQQSGFTQMLYGFPRLLGTFGTKTMTAFGTLAGLGSQGISAGLGYGFDWDKAVDNAWIQYWNATEENMKKEWPIYHTKAVQQGNVLKQFSSPSTWNDEGIDAFAFFLSNILPGQALSKLGSVAKITRGLATGTEALTPIGKATVSALKASKDPRWLNLPIRKLSEGMDMVAQNTFMSAIEAGVETADTRRTLAKTLRSQVNPKTGQLYNEYEIKQILDKESNRIFGGNMALLMMTNIPEVNALFRNTTKIRNIGELTKEVIENPTKSALFKSFAKGAGKSVVSESMEENVQLAMQNYAQTNGISGEDDNVDKFITGTVTNVLNNFSTTEGQKAMVLGAIIGLIPGGIGGFKEMTNEVKTKQLLQNDFLKNYGGVAEFYKTKDVNGKPEVELINGKIQLNEDKLIGIVTKQLDMYNMFAEISKAAKSGDDASFGILEKGLLSNVLYPLYDSGLDNISANAYLEKLAENDKTGRDKKVVLESYKKTADILYRNYKRANGMFAGVQELAADPKDKSKYQALKAMQYSYMNNIEFENEIINAYEGIKNDYQSEIDKINRDNEALEDSKRVKVEDTNAYKMLKKTEEAIKARQESKDTNVRALEQILTIKGQEQVIEDIKSKHREKAKVAAKIAYIQSEVDKVNTEAELNVIADRYKDDKDSVTIVEKARKKIVEKEREEVRKVELAKQAKKDAEAKALLDAENKRKADEQVKIKAAEDAKKKGETKGKPPIVVPTSTIDSTKKTNSELVESDEEADFIEIGRRLGKDTKSGLEAIKEKQKDIDIIKKANEPELTDKRLSVLIDGILYGSDETKTKVHRSTFGYKKKLIQGYVDQINNVELKAKYQALLDNAVRPTPQELGLVVDTKVEEKVVNTVEVLIETAKLGTDPNSEVKDVSIILNENETNTYNLTNDTHLLDSKDNAKGETTLVDDDNSLLESLLTSKIKVGDKIEVIIDKEQFNREEDTISTSDGERLAADSISLKLKIEGV